MNHFIKLHTLFYFIIIIAIISLMVLYLCCGFPVYSFLPSSDYCLSTETLLSLNSTASGQCVGDFFLYSIIIIVALLCNHHRYWGWQR